MNNRGQTIFFSLMIGIVLFFLGINLAHPLSDVIKDARTQTNSSAGVEVALNCSTATEYQDKANCVIVDLFLPLFIGTLFGLAGFILTQI
jgi:hypothetical protein